MFSYTWFFFSFNVFSQLYVFFTAFSLTKFLSGNTSGVLCASNNHEETPTAQTMMVDSILIFLFIATHSLCASTTMKQLSSVIHRSVYNFVSCLFLQILMTQWIVLLPAMPLVWNICDNNFMIKICQLFHVLAWLTVFSTIFILDFFEFVGTKQVYYFHCGFGCPLSSKTIELQGLYKNMRHPVSSGILIVLWMVPCMTVDRLLLSSVFTLYLLHGCQLNEFNHTYVMKMYAQKANILKSK